MTNDNTLGLAEKIMGIAVWLTDERTSEEFDIEEEMIPGALEMLSGYLGDSDKGSEQLKLILALAKVREYEMHPTPHLALVEDLLDAGLLDSIAWQKTLAARGGWRE